MLVHLNGQIVPVAEAKISAFDRGFIFGDGVYEGLRAIRTPTGRRVIGLRRHIKRLAGGLATTRIEWDAEQLGPLVMELLAANKLDDAFVYLQVSRGTPPPGAPVRWRVPAPGTRPTVLAYCTPLGGLDEATGPATKAASVQEDFRWLRGNVKTTSLIGNIMLSLAAADRGADEAILVRPGQGGTLVTEGAYTNVMLVTDHGELVTPSLDSAPVLPGVTRQILVDLDKTIVERPVRASELETAREVMLIGTTTMVTTVTAIDGRTIGQGKPGPEARRIFKVLVEAIRAGREDA